MNPSFNPSSQPSYDPSSQPSYQPSNQPSLQPTDQPSSSPIILLPVCDYNTGGYTVNWENLLTVDSTSSSLSPQLTSSQVNNNNNVIEIEVVATANYVVDADYFGNNVGVTYVLDTKKIKNGYFYSNFALTQHKKLDF